jgi:hypothetical protein
LDADSNEIKDLSILFLVSKVAKPHLLMSIPTPRARDRCAERNIGALSTMCASEAGRSGLELRYKVNGSADMTDTALVRA